MGHWKAKTADVHGYSNGPCKSQLNISVGSARMQHHKWQREPGRPSSFPRNPRAHPAAQLRQATCREQRDAGEDGSRRYVGLDYVDVESFDS